MESDTVTATHVLPPSHTHTHTHIQKVDSTAQRKKTDAPTPDDNGKFVALFFKLLPAGSGLGWMRLASVNVQTHAGLGVFSNIPVSPCPVLVLYIAILVYRQVTYVCSTWL